MTDSMPVRVTVRILDKDFHVACPPEERDDLVRAADFLNGKLRDLKEQVKGASGNDRVLVIAALNMANELMKHKARGDQDGKVGIRLKNLREKVDTALERGQQLEL